MSRVRNLQKFLKDILIISHHRDEQGRLAVLVHSLGQGRLFFYQLERDAILLCPQRMAWCSTLNPALSCFKITLLDLLVGCRLRQCLSKI